jgi:DNA-binding NtrC family response regulator
MSPIPKFEVVSLDEVPMNELCGQARAAKPVVLIVDDEPVVADSLSMILALSGYETMTAYGGETALELVKAQTPALLISDVVMPDMNGVELAMAIRLMLPECGVLLFSGHATSRDLISAREAGYDFPLLRKPVPPAEMLRHISQIFQGADRKKASVPIIPAPSAGTFAKSA